MRNILVIGGTGTVGSQVVNELIEKNLKFSVLTRSPEKAKVLENKGISAVVGTLGEWDNIQAILTDFDTLFLATSPAANMIDLHKKMIDLAKENSISKIVRLSAEPANYPKGLYMYEQHAQADVYLRESGLDYVILRAHYFMQNSMMHLEMIKAQNSFAQYSRSAKLSMIDVRDIALAAVSVMVTSEFDNNTYTITGPEAIGYSDIAKVFSAQMDKTIQYIDLPYADQEAGFKAYGMEEWQLSTVMNLFKIWADLKVSAPTNDFKTITGVEARSFEEFTKDHAFLFANMVGQSN